MWVSIPARAGDMKVLVEVDQPADLRALARLDASVEEHLDRAVLVRVTRQGYRALLDAGFSVAVVVADVDALIGETPDAARAQGYHSYDDMVSAMETVAVAHGEIVRLIVIGHSVEGRDIVAVKISDNPSEDENEPELLFDGATHGNEWSGFEVAIALVHHLTDNYGQDPEVTGLVDEREIWVVPMVNPDGVVANTRENANKVDCNRDFGYMWDGWAGSTAPFSQPENRAIGDLAFDNQFTMATSFHGGAVKLVYAWSFTESPSADTENLRVLGKGYGDLADMSSGQASSLMSIIAGSSKDAHYGTGGTMAWTVELTCDKIPPYSEIPALCERNVAASMHLISKSGQGLTGAITSAADGNPVAAVIRIGDAGWMAYADPMQGDVHRFLVPGTYDLTIWANGYEPAQMTGVQVLAGQQTDISIALQPQEDPLLGAYKVLYNAKPDAEDGSTETIDVLGAPDAQGFLLGRGGYIVVDMGPTLALSDQPGDDIMVHESNGTSRAFELYGADQRWGPWTEIGQGQGTFSFDLAGIGLGAPRYLKIADLEDRGTDPGVEREGGYALDAVQAVAAPDLDTDSDSDSDTDSDGDGDSDTDADGDEDAGSDTDVDSDDDDDDGESFSAVTGACGCGSVGPSRPSSSLVRALSSR